MNEFIHVMLMFVMCGCCTFNMSVVHTEGQASDVVDDTATLTPTTTNSASIPLKLPLGNPLKR